MTTGNQWYKIENEDEVYSPSLLIYPDRIENNICKMVEMARDADRLRPHVKTHKMAEIVRMQMKHGINKFKCATISEAEMVAGCGATDILLAMQPVGPNIERFFRLKKAYRGVNFSCIVDSEQIIHQLSETGCRYDLETSLWIDINVGMNRTGITPDEEAIRIFKLADSLPKLKAEGLHVYDGHIHEKNFSLRTDICNEAWLPVGKMRNNLKTAGFSNVRVVAGGTPTFPVHASKSDVEISPGTILLWDFGYSSSFSDLNFQHAAVLFTRVVSKPAKDIICLDLGHKAVGSEMPQPRIMIPSFNDFTIIGHSEEHMVIRAAQAENIRTGDTVYAIPWHICPTVDRYDSVYVVTESRVSGKWNVAARKREITF
ncbi:MAG: D-TA family PLP-dependent enzyme [Bacteroidales bacterium]|nr:D-TA family PLP-dependent enzyme [Bacteroidales bacterium]